MKRRTFLVIVLAVVVALGLQNYVIAPAKTGAADASAGKESAYDRVMRTRAIRCGYFVWPPFLAKDPNTGAFSGLGKDLMDALSKVLNLQIEWAEELNYGTYLQDLASGRYDMECSGGWPNAQRGQLAYYSKPYAFIPSVAMTRPDDARFDQDQNLINQPSVTIATIDGETTSFIRESRFPQTKQFSLPSNAQFSEAALNVTMGKADVTFRDLITAKQYEASNPGKIKIINYDPPVFLIALTLGLPQDEKLKAMIDVALDQLQFSGQIENIIKKHETTDAKLLRVNTFYRN